MERFITLGGGCFWCVEAAFLRLKGVTAVQSGYANGHVPEPSYAQVCRGDTGHAEVVRVTYEDSQITLNQLLDVFFAVHDPSTLNRQGHDVGPQYRSAVFTESSQDLAEVERYMVDLVAAPSWEGPNAVTEVAELVYFWPAEPEHDTYFDRNPWQGYCRVVIAPKIEKVQDKFASILKP